MLFIQSNVSRCVLIVLVIYFVCPLAEPQLPASICWSADACACYTGTEVSFECSVQLFPKDGSICIGKGTFHLHLNRSVFTTDGF